MGQKRLELGETAAWAQVAAAHCSRGLVWWPEHRAEGRAAAMKLWPHAPVVRSHAVTPATVLRTATFRTFVLQWILKEANSLLQPQPSRSPSYLLQKLETDSGKAFQADPVCFLLAFSTTKILLTPVLMLSLLAVKEYVYLQGKKENCHFTGLEVALAGESHRGENEPMETTRQELGTDALQDADGGCVVIQDVALRREPPALQLPRQCEGHQLAVAFPTMLWQGVAMAHGGKLVCDRPRNWVSLVIADTHTGEAGDEVGYVPETLLVAAPRPRPVE